MARDSRGNELQRSAAAHQTPVVAPQRCCGLQQFAALVVAALLLCACGAELPSEPGGAPPGADDARGEGTGRGEGGSANGETEPDGEGDGESPGGGVEGAESEGGGPTRAVPLDRVDIELDRSIEPGSTSVDAAADELRDRGNIGGNDTLTPGGEGALGDRVVTRARQEHNGIPVYAAEVVVTSEGDRVVTIRGHPAPGIELPSTTPANDYAATVALAERRLNEDISTDEADEGTLVIFAVNGGYRLAWLSDVVIDRGPERVVFDAETGEVLHRVPTIHQFYDGRVYDFALACDDAGVWDLVDQAIFEILLANAPLVRSETVNIGDRSAERLFDILGSLYTFIELTLRMDSFDGSGAPIEAIIGVRFHDATPWPQCVGDAFNAAWLPDVMLLPRAALDFPAIIGHELTHGLIDHGSALIYRRQPGALNEAISDAMGLTFAAWLDRGAVRDADAALRMRSRDWQMRDPDGLTRDMRDPRRVRLSDGTRMPDHYDDFVHTRADNGGVHINSSIINHGFYLLAEGGRHSRRGGPVVEGIGAMRAAHIFGNAAKWLLTPNSDFRDARYAFADAAEALYGTASPEWTAVHTAMDAVGVPGTWRTPPTTPTDPPTTPTDPPTPPTTPPALPTDPPTTPTTPTDPPATPTTPTDPPATPTDPPTDRPDPRTDPPDPRTDPPDPPTDPPDSPTDPSPDEAAGNNDVLVFGLMGGLAALAAAMLVRLRPRTSARANRLRHHRSPSAVPHRERAAAAPAPAPAPVPPQPPTPCDDILLGTLLPGDGSPPIPLGQAQLRSPEGLVIGRDIRLCHLEVPDPAVSRRHLRLRGDGGAILVEDLNSLEGTRVGGVDLKPFEPRRVTSGQVLTIAGISYRLQFGGAAARHRP